MKTVDKLKQLIPGLLADNQDVLRSLPSTTVINETILGCLVSTIRTDGDVFEFCDIMESLCDDNTTENLIRSLRNGV